MATSRLRAIARPGAAGALLGAGYALAMRLAFHGVFEGYELFSHSFFLGVPVGIGALTMWLALRQGQSAWAGLRALMFSVVIFIAVCMLTLLEGLICIVLLLPVLILVPLLGSALAYALWVLLGRKSRPAMLSIAALPLVMGPLEMTLPVDATPFTVTDTVVIDAPPAVVWQRLTSVGRIAPDELRPAFVFAMGVPRPVEARMDVLGEGTVRTSIWEKGVVFHEKITTWRPGREMAYRFDFDPRLIPSAAFDEHVRLGGRHYQIISGGYRLRALPGGQTELELSTTAGNLSRTGWYGRAWAEVVFGDFHGVILDLIRTRSEAEGQA